jgi:hypothetical protein
MTINVYNIGQKVRLQGIFKVLGVNTDPTTITLKIKSPAGVSTTYTFALGTVTRSDTGIYYKDLSINASGAWHYNWTGTGLVEAADETWLLVEHSEF